MLPSDKTMLSYRSIRAIISSFVAGVVAERSGYAQRWFGLAVRAVSDDGLWKSL